MKRILILANSDVGLYKFRRELIENLLNKYEVYISLPNGIYINQLEKLGCKFIETQVNRRGTNPLTDLKLMNQYKKIIKEIKPFVVLTYTIKPNIYGGIICGLTKTPYISNITGLGTSIENNGLVSYISLILYKWGLKKSNCIFFQNESNKQFFLRNGIIDSNYSLIPGSGVNLLEHAFEDYPVEDGIIRFLFIGRIMKSKGISELLESAKKIHLENTNVEFDLVGDCEEDYQKILTDYSSKKIIHYHGQQYDVHTFIKRSHATILPSYHEGTANVLLETLASGRPVLASMVPGCKETFDEGISGYGFESKDTESLTKTILKFINLTYEKKRIMGIEGRKKMEEQFDRNIVVNAYIDQIAKVGRTAK